MLPANCNRYYKELGTTCRTETESDVDLTKYFNKIYMERPYEGFTPDILLSSEVRKEVLFVEIAVTHRCDNAKIESGKRIIEINISDEDDFSAVLSCRLSDQAPNINTYNFKKKTIKRDICNGDCENEVNLFVIYESQKSILLELSPSEAINPDIRGKVRHMEILGHSSSDLEKQTIIYRNKVREAHFKRIPIKNCFICRYHGGDGIENAIFCKFRKESVGSNEAASCSYYKTFHNIKECQAADKANDEYAKNNESRIITNAFMRIVNRNIF